MDKITLNGIPVYREIKEDETWYYLFEYDLNGNIIRINNHVTPGHQLDVVYRNIQERVKQDLKIINTFMYGM